MVMDPHNERIDQFRMTSQLRVPWSIMADMPKIRMVNDRNVANFGNKIEYTWLKSRINEQLKTKACLSSNVCRSGQMHKHA